MAKEKVIFNFADGPKEIKVGDTFIAVHPNDSRRGVSKFKVDKIGITLITAGREKFYIATGRRQTEYTAEEAYSSEEAYQIIRKQDSFIRKVRNHFDYRSKITYEQAVKIAEIIGLKEEL